MTRMNGMVLHLGRILCDVVICSWTVVATSVSAYAKSVHNRSNSYAECFIRTVTHNDMPTGGNPVMSML